ncbi:MAG: hypothetical protein A3J79_13695 [Elusimicrobia bacterium RIFOXYB2_FULL_62_6]|nr:MAG: hypothetical protein A3J79_13695 [Elusimicrobia bacterium RIFOXYB2_FULL_62_6]
MIRAAERMAGRIRPRVAAVKALASAVCVGSVDFAGREGPIVRAWIFAGGTGSGGRSWINP